MSNYKVPISEGGKDESEQPEQNSSSNSAVSTTSSCALKMQQSTCNYHRDAVPIFSTDAARQETARLAVQAEQGTGTAPDDPLGGPGKCGRKYLEYCAMGYHVKEHLPDIDIKIKV